jgi:prepilin-type N-terminal cleavage/methylation domain-containing protein
LSSGIEGSTVDRGPRGLSLVEVLVSLSLVASIGVAATGLGVALAALATAARAEAVGLALASEKLEELIATSPELRGDGFDEVERSGVRVVRQWRVATGDPEPELSRLEVTARWDRPELTVLVLAALAR